MLVAVKKNRMLRIDDLKADEYVAMGYTVYDKDGEAVLYEPVTLESLQKQVGELLEENHMLKLKIDSLQHEMTTKVIGKKTNKVAEDVGSV